MGIENVIYISSHGVMLLSGSCDKSDMIKISDFKEELLSEGAMINGVITDEGQVLEVLKSFRASGIKHAKLVIDSGQILIKNVEVPALKQNELMKVVQDELSNLDEGYEDIVYDYSVLQQEFKEEGKQGGEILCCGVERKLLTSYVELFAAAEIELKGIDISVNALHKLTRELADLENKTYIVSVLDANNVSSYLFENNKYTFSNRTRLFSERGTQAFITEMNSSISQLIQFNKSKQSPYAIGTAYFCGVSETEEELLFDSIRQNLDINACVFPSSKFVYVTDRAKEDEFDLHKYVYNVGCLIRK